MNKNSLMSLFLLAFCLSITSAHAATVQYSDGKAVGLIGLEVSGDYFDVHFEYASYVTIWGFNPNTWSTLCSEKGGPENPHPCGLGDPSGALGAADAINEVFNSEGVEQLMAADGSAHDLFAIAYLFDSCADSYVKGSYADGSWVNDGDGFNTCFPNQRPFAVFQPGVPIPAAVWLFGSALTGLGWFRRKTA
jgi:hypothetical protein